MKEDQDEDGNMSFGRKLRRKSMKTSFGGERDDSTNVNRLSRPSLPHKGIRQNGGLVPFILNPYTI